MGGLLRLLQTMGASLAGSVGLGAWWHTTVLPATPGPTFQFGFHIFVGILMAIAYGLVLEPALPGRPWVKGLIYAAVLWLLNSAVLLPLIGEGLAGSRHLNTAGIMCFAAAHTVFFVLLAVLTVFFVLLAVLYDPIERWQPGRE